MDVQQLVSEARDAVTVKRVFGEPYERNGVTVIPAAVIRGGGGGGGDNSSEEGGAGAGFGIIARPVGAYVIKDGNVSWQPAFDLNRAIMIGGLLSALAMRRVFRKRRRK